MEIRYEMPVYSCADFHNIKNIGVICRGISLGKIGKYRKYFKNSLLVGQHVQSFKKVGHHLKNFNLVQVCGGTIFLTKKKVCKARNIRDLQTGLDPTLSARRKLKFRHVVNKNSWLSVHPFPENFRDRNARLDFGTLSHPTTGLFAVDLAVAFKPKNVFIIGLDFYKAPYFVKEKNQAKVNPGRGDSMLKYFKALCDIEKDIKFHLCTCYDGMKSNDNLKVIRV